MRKVRNDDDSFFWKEQYDIHRIQISKGNFAEMANKKKNKSGAETQRVYGKFNLEFDLQQIFNNIDECKKYETQQQRRNILLKSMSQITMHKVDVDDTIM